MIGPLVSTHGTAADDFRFQRRLHLWTLLKPRTLQKAVPNLDCRYFHDLPPDNLSKALIGLGSAVLNCIQHLYDLYILELIVQAYLPGSYAKKHKSSCNCICWRCELVQFLSISGRVLFFSPSKCSVSHQSQKIPPPRPCPSKLLRSCKNSCDMTPNFGSILVSDKFQQNWVPCLKLTVRI